MRMINTPIPTIDVNSDDSRIIESLYAATLKAEKGYEGTVICLAPRLYELNMHKCMIVSRAALIKAMNHE
ncbi:hypothetical protein VPH1254_0041 [Vibrio phage 1254]|nr:hypothetical protein SIPHO018v1_120002 [Vibrio phage 11E33.1]QZI92559.1 hypothetical protein SIPHO017v1_p0026 [Vibrio phage 19E33.1]QZI92830.1 hypothetical protein SIPHO016v1_p0051 [Vibrio phage 38E33.6a]QZI92956.1 hypothetical protein SIPHO015v1_p0018 [Vibrio phage 82E32.2]QZI93025.1 hypothetical protein SIPHO014v1_p0026 [Vibrio phage 82E32.3]QZI93072.1 hypothetical protein SIPHO013v1_p0011 [Vibrio phage 82E33.2]